GTEVAFGPGAPGDVDGAVGGLVPHPGDVGGDGVQARVLCPVQAGLPVLAPEPEVVDLAAEDQRGPAVDQDLLVAAGDRARRARLARGGGAGGGCGGGRSGRGGGRGGGHAGRGGAEDG